MQILHRNKEAITGLSGTETVDYLRVTKVDPTTGKFLVSIPHHLVAAASFVAPFHDIDFRRAEIGGNVVSSTCEKAEMDWRILVYWCRQYLLTGEAGRVAADLMNVDQLASFLGVETSWVYGQSKKLPHVKVGKHLRFDRQEVLNYLRQKPQQVCSHL